MSACESRQVLTEATAACPSLPWFSGRLPGLWLWRLRRLRRLRRLWHVGGLPCVAVAFPDRRGEKAKCRFELRRRGEGLQGGQEIVGRSVAVFLQEPGGVFPIQSEGVIAEPRTEVDTFADLEVKVGEIRSVSGSDRPDDLASVDLVVNSDVERTEVGVEGLEEPAVVEPVLEEDHVSPSGRCFGGVEDEPVSNGVDRITKVGILTPDAIQIVSEMVHLAEGSGVVGEGAVFTPEGRGETGAARRAGQFQGRG